MGLSSKQVSSDGVGWSRSLLQAQTLEIPPKASPMKRQQHLQNHQQQQLEPPLKCPRCDSSNTKFCYYNNYNKSQHRHFCKACKRHWTKGGTLRNVPVGGGGRKNKRLKTSNSKAGGTASTTSTAAIKTSTISGVNNRLKSFTVIQSQQQRQEEHHKLPLADQKNISNMQFQALRRPSSSSSLLQQNSINCSILDGKIFSASNGVFLGSSSSSSTLSLTQTQGLQFPFPFSSSSSSSFDTSQSSISTSFQSSSIYNYSGGETMEDPTTINSVIMPTATSATDSQTWQVPITSSCIDMANYWNWDDIDALVSTDLNTMPWDDSEIKP